MPCYSPLSAYQLEGGEIVFAERGSVLRSLELPCGQCIGCRLERSRVWAMRCMHEASLYDDNWFLTLTYDEKNLPSPPSLDYRHFQLFMKRLRKKRDKVRFYMCGEYGEQYDRPHYHACLFNLKLDDLVVYSSAEGRELYTSKFLNSLWQKGQVMVGAVTFDSAAYVARYCMKKVTGRNAEEYYHRFYLSTGEVYDAKPEFNSMSRRPGIGRGWIDKFGPDVFNYDHVIVNGFETRPGRYYDKVRAEVDPLGLEEAKCGRLEKANSDDNTEARLAVKAAVARSRLNLKHRYL
jgi:hypothetical protein